MEWTEVMTAIKTNEKHANLKNKTSFGNFEMFFAFEEFFPRSWVVLERFNLPNLFTINLSLTELLCISRSLSLSAQQFLFVEKVAVSA